MARSMICKGLKRHHNTMGVTLIELVVVLVILSILAGAGVATTIGYMKRSQFTQNEKNAETVYQAVQTSLLQKEKSGSLDTWVQDELISRPNNQFVVEGGNTNTDPSFELNYTADNQTAFNALTSETASAYKTNYSVHMRYQLTYDPSNNSSSECIALKDLIQPYFYDATVFGGMLTVEFDVEKIVDGYHQIHYSARCLSVFSSSLCKEGWDSASKDDHEFKVPKRDWSYRRYTSLVGYYNGYEGTVVDTVYLPQVQEGIIVQDYKFDKDAKTITWTATLDGQMLTGTKTDVYYQINLYGTGSNPVKTFIINQDFMNSEWPLADSKNDCDYFEKLAITNIADINGLEVKTETIDVIYPGNVIKEVTRKTVTIENALVYTYDPDTYLSCSEDDVKSAERSTAMKLYITYVSGELDTDPYVEYTLDLSGTGVLTSDIKKAGLTIYPNEFTASNMTIFNDSTGIVPYRKEISAAIEIT